MLGELLYEGKGRLAGSRILNVDEYKVEHSMIEEGKIKDIETTMLGTFWTIPSGKNITYVEGQGIITTKDGEDTATFRGYGIGTSKGQISVSFRGSVFYKSSSSSTNGKLSFLNNKIGVFESEVDESGTSNEKHWNGNNDDFTNDFTIQDCSNYCFNHYY
jgi:hypothetical protein